MLLSLYDYTDTNILQGNIFKYLENQSTMHRSLRPRFQGCFDSEYLDLFMQLIQITKVC